MRIDTLGTTLQRRKLFHIKGNIPLIGHIAFGVIDRGTNLIQVRPSSLCPLSCIFCSVDAGPYSLRRVTEYLVELRQLVEWVKWSIEVKGLRKAQIHVDSVGDPLTYPRIVEFINLVSSMKNVDVVSLETRGALLTEKLVERLDEVGLSRINLSIDALDPKLARYLSGTPWFNVKKVLEIARYITSSLKMDLIITPVWVPGVNDEEIPKIIEFALNIGAGKRWPPLGIQKYEAHKYGRKPKGVKPLTWYHFYNKLREWESEYGVKLILSPKDFGIVKAKSVPKAYKRGEKASVTVAGPGWFKGQWIATGRGRVLTIVGVKGEPDIGRKVKVRVLRNKDNIYVAEPVY